MPKKPVYIPNFKSVAQLEVPHSRKGKHNKIVTEILADLTELNPDSALRVPIKDLDDTLANVRSALSRASRKQGKKVATAADEDFLYVWVRPSVIKDGASPKKPAAD